MPETKSIGLRVLVVDDDVDTTELLTTILEANAFVAMTCNAGSEAVELARKHKPDAIVLDLLMPDMDGLQVCREVRRFSDVPIMVLSAVNKPGIVAQALDVGADDYMMKPMKSNIFIATLRRLTRRAKIEQEARLASRVILAGG